MPILDHEVRTVFNTSKTSLKRRLLIRREYRTIVEMGMFDGERIELIEGEIVHMAPIGNAHGSVIHTLAPLLEAAFGTGFAARNQAPIALGADRQPSEPQPDITIVLGSLRDYGYRQPTPEDIGLVVEVADNSLREDRNIKGPLYAAANIPEYWIVNLVDNVLEVYRGPNKGTYTSLAYHKPGDQITPLPATDYVAVSDFMP